MQYWSGWDVILGQSTVYTGPDANPWRYKGAAGYYFDRETGDYYLQRRFYTPRTGRFTQEDPIRWGMNWYLYASNNPIRFIDPTGLFDVDTVLSRANNAGVFNDDVKVLQDFLMRQGFLSRPTSKTGVAFGFFCTVTESAITAWKNAITGGSGVRADLSGTIDISWWRRTGGIYRTVADRDAGVEIATIGFRQYFDISVPVANALVRDVGMFESRSGNNFISKNLWFASMVGDAGIWNVKANRGEMWTNTLGISFWGYSTQMRLNGAFVTVEDVGNITYGFLGAAIGFSQSWLNVGSSVNHFGNHGFRNWANERADQANFATGINWYTSGTWRP
jgi:RHS repeat-associated protein